MGDAVLLRVKAFRQDHKIMDRWQQNPHIVLIQMGNQASFKVQPKDAKDQEGIRILHSSMLYLIQSAQSGAQDTTDQPPVTSMTALPKGNLLMDLLLVMFKGGEGDWYGDQTLPSRSE